MVCEHLSTLEQALLAQGFAVTFRGQAWSMNCREWVYFDCFLDTAQIRNCMSLSDCVHDHSHRGTHDGQNMIVRKGKSKAVSSVAEIHSVTAILERAVSLMRQELKGQPPLHLDEKELIKAMQQDDFFKPIVETVDNQFFGLSKGERVVFINTPILFRLTLVKAHNDKFKILWAEPYTGG